MKPIWIVDDDQSIRFVLERALQREGLVTRSFTEANQVLAALADAEASELPSVLVSDIRMPGGERSGIACKSEDETSGSPHHHHDRLLRFGQRGLGVPRGRF